MSSLVPFGHLRTVLEGLGFKEKRRQHGIALTHRESDTILLFRTHADEDSVTPAEMFIVRKLLDEKGILEPESLDALLMKTPA